MERSTLIRFTSSRFADSYRFGNLWLSSLWTFWDFMDGKIREEDMKAGKVTEEDLQRAIETDQIRRNDFSEGVIAQIPRSHVSHLFGSMSDRVIHDIRFRLSAYKYCNLMCFFRVDAEDADQGILDEENAAAILRSHGKEVTANTLRSMNPRDVQMLVGSVIKPNPIMTNNKVHMVQLPDSAMDKFGDIVVVIKEEDEFKRRVLNAVEKAGGHLIMGDVRYHPLVDRVDPSTMRRHSMTIISSSTTPKETDYDDKTWLAEDGSFKLSDIADIDDIYWRGALDKYDVYRTQKEWRICWLPEELDYKERILRVGELDDIIDIVKTENIRDYLLERYRGYAPGTVEGTRREITGTESYKEFCGRMKKIDGLGDYVMEIG